MEKKINRMYLKDCLSILTTMIVLWVTLIFVMINVYSVASNQMLEITIVLVGVIACSLASSALFAVIVHLKKNRSDLYSEDIAVLMQNSNN